MVHGVPYGGSTRRYNVDHTLRRSLQVLVCLLKLDSNVRTDRQGIWHAALTHSLRWLTEDDTKRCVEFRAWGLLCA